jgi:LmbE family N-acetylglucosaminyl deacetylase
MLGVRFRKEADSGLNLLFFGAHCDDIEIGCGGTILKLIQQYKVHVKWVVFSSNAQRAVEAEECARSFLEGASSRDVKIMDFKDGFLSQRYSDVKDYYEQIKKEFVPDVVFTHYRNDLHQDHRLLSELAWNTFRDHVVLEYEIPKYDGDLGNPNLFVELEEQLVDKKIKNLLDHYVTQRDKHWFDKETFVSVMRLRGIQSASRYAEGFYSRKLIM